VTPPAARRARIERLRALVRVSHVVASSSDLDAALAVIARSACGLAGAAAAALWVVDEAGSALSARVLSDPRLADGLPPGPVRIGDQAVGRVALCHRPIDVPDVHAASPPPGPLEWFRRHGLTGFSGIPVVFRDDLLAVLALYGAGPLRLEDDDREVLGALAAQAAAAIRNARLLAETDARRRSAEALADLGRLVSQTLDVQVVAQRIAESVLSLLGVLSSAVYRIDPESGGLVTVATAQRPGSTFRWAPVLPRGTGVAGLAVAGRAPVTTPDALADPRLSFSPETRASLEGSDYRAVLAVPFLVHDRAIGALGVGDRAGRVFDDGAIRLAQAFADHGAVALENARLYEVAERRLREAEALADIAHRLTEGRDVAAVGARIVEAVVPLFRVRSSALWLLESDGSLRAVARGGSPAHIEAGDTLAPGRGLPGLVAAGRAPLRSADVLAETGVDLGEPLRRRIEATGDRAFLGVPLEVADRLVGVLTVTDAAGRTFGDADITLLQALADEAALALERTRLLEEAERRRREAEEAEARYRGLFERNLAGIFRARREGPIVECNEAFARLLGYGSRQALVGCDLATLHADPADAASLLDRLRSGQAVSGAEVRWHRTDGTAITVLMGMAVVGEGDEAIIEGVVVDVTDRKRAEQAEREAATLRSVAQLANAAAHEINNPLAVVIANLQLLSQQVRGDATARARIDAAVAGGRRIAEMVTLMGNITRLEVSSAWPGLPSILDLRRSAGGAPATGTPGDQEAGS
jgi:PAS domain S-box-containing protein